MRYSFIRPIAGLPNVRPQGRMRPPCPFYAAPGPYSKNRAGCKNYYCYLFADSTLLYLHRWFPLLCIWTDTVLSCIIWNFLTGDTVRHFSLNCWLRHQRYSIELMWPPWRKGWAPLPYWIVHTIRSTTTNIALGGLCSSVVNRSCWWGTAAGHCGTVSLM